VTAGGREPRRKIAPGRHRRFHRTAPDGARGGSTSRPALHPSSFAEEVGTLARSGGAARHRRPYVDPLAARATAMSPPGRPKGECRSAKHEGTPVSLDAFIAAAWNDHGDHPEEVANRLAGALDLLESPAGVPPFAAGRSPWRRRRSAPSASGSARSPLTTRRCSLPRPACTPARGRARRVPTRAEPAAGRKPRGRGPACAAMHRRLRRQRCAALRAVLRLRRPRHRARAGWRRRGAGDGPPARAGSICTGRPGREAMVRS